MGNSSGLDYREAVGGGVVRLFSQKQDAMVMSLRWNLREEEEHKGIVGVGKEWGLGDAILVKEQ